MNKPTIKKLDKAIETLADHHRGHAVLASLLAMFRAGGDALDIANQEAVLTIISAKFGAYAGTTTEKLKEALGNGSAPDRQTLKVSLCIDGEAFADDHIEEIRRILNNLCDRLPSSLRDTNGDLNLHDFNRNHVGTARID